VSGDNPHKPRKKEDGREGAAQEDLKIRKHKPSMFPTAVATQRMVIVINKRVTSNRRPCIESYFEGLMINLDSYNSNSTIIAPEIRSYPRNGTWDAGSSSQWDRKSSTMYKGMDLLNQRASLAVDPKASSSYSEPSSSSF
jgi:hypothetical protein